MSHEKQHAKTGGTPDGQDTAVGNRAIADQARQMANRVSRLGKDILASFQLSDPAQRVAHLQHIVTEIYVGMIPVVGWLERRRSAETAELVKLRLHRVCSEAVECSRCEIPEYAGGMIKRASGSAPSEGARRTAELVSHAKVYADSLQQWAKEIEADNEQATRFVTFAWEGDDWDEVEPQVRRLLSYMKDRQQADLAELCPEVWAKDYAAVTDAALQTATSKANTFLRKRQSTHHLEKVRGEPFLRWV